MAGEVIAEHGGVDDAVAIAAEVKSRYRAGIVRSKLQEDALPGLRSDGGRAYLAACSECHQPPHPAMYAASDWRQSLSRMEAYLDQSTTVAINEQTWNAAVEYIRETADTYPPEAGEQYRQSIANAVEHLMATEGESANYPSNQDPILGPEWFERAGDPGGSVSGGAAGRSGSELPESAGLPEQWRNCFRGCGRCGREARC